jgi:hypothetical protein
MVINLLVFLTLGIIVQGELQRSSTAAKSDQNGTASENPLSQSENEKNRIQHPWDQESSTSNKNGSLCADISGKWYNQHGSEVMFKQWTNAQLSGSFTSSVNLNRSKKPSDLVTGKLIGHFHNGNLGFSVLWEAADSSDESGNHQRPSTAHAGTCYLDNNSEVLVVSWIIAEKQESVADSWKGFRVGQDHYTRMKNKKELSVPKFWSM